MKKVKVTREQAEAIEEFQKTVHELGISSDELKGIFESGYEVKPEFKVGDFIEIELFGRGVVVEITGINNADGRIRINGSSEFNEYNVIRKLTDEEIQQEKERRWWKKHGREPWELKKGDVIIGHYTKYIHVISKDSDESGYYIEGYHCDAKEIKHNFKVLTFAENRLDVK